MTDAAMAQMPNAIRIMALDAVKAANSGHSGMPMGMADAATVLFTRHMKLDPSDPNWPDRDRFVLSAGHGSMLIYAVNHLLGYKDMTIEQVKNFRQLGSITAGHPEHGHADGIETTTGPLGQGIANAVGMALAEKMLAARFGPELVDHHTYVFAGDGCLMEGISHEAIDLAGHLNLAKLVVFFDDNAVTIDGTTEMSTSMDQKTRFSAAGWNVMEVDGHDMDALDAAIETAKGSDKPTMIACKTIIGFGAPTLAGKAKAHGAITGDEEIAGVRDAVGWDHDPFVIPDDVLQLWRSAGAEGAEHREAWEERLNKSTDGEAFKVAIAGKLPEDLASKINEHKAKMAAEAPKLATRAASGKALEVINNRCIGSVHQLRRSRAHHGIGHERNRTARRVYSVRRDLSRFYRLRSACDPPFGSDGAASDLCHDPRLHWCRRRRPDAPTRRTCRRLALDPKPQRLPPMRCSRGGRSLAGSA